MVTASAAMLGGCNYWDDIFGEVEPSGAVAVDRNTLSPSASMFVWGGNKGSAGVGTRAIIDQITTRTLDSNFLRIDENINSTTNQGLYTFNQWNKATVLEASIISSPDNTDGIYYRSVTFIPTQTYNIYVAPYNPGEQADTTFYHTRIVGWYPRNCFLQRNDNNKAVTALFENSRFDSQRHDLGEGRWGVVFDKVLDGKTDLMMSNLKEGQQWHNDSGTEVAYAQPFGHNEAFPKYSNYVTYKHYLSAVRIWAYADAGTQNLQTWGNILGLTFVNQPTSCTIEIPNTLGAFGEVVTDSWSDFQNIHAVTTLMYGEEDINHRDDDYQASYPVNMSAHTSEFAPTYLGYCLVQPNHTVEISIRTNAGTYNAILPSTITDPITGTTTQLFEASKIYDFKLNLKTSGTIEIYIQNEDVDNFVNLSPWNTENGEYETANSYIIDSSTLDFSGEEYPGFCFCANVIGNGENGFMSQGSTTFHTSSSEITNLNSVDLVWESSRGLISNLQLQHGYIRFLLPGQEVGGVRQAVEGNAVVCMKDSSGNILWSWHIWITDRPQDVTYTFGGTSTMTIMDRNLGATAGSFTNSSDLVDTYGLYYQWGRKDPSPLPPTYNYNQQDMSIRPVYDYSINAIDAAMSITGTNTLITGIRNPVALLYATGSEFYVYDWLYENINFLWGDGTNKTIYDPCPYGYRVPANEITNLFAQNPTYTPTLTSDGYGGLNVTFGGVTTFFPCAGYKGPDRGLPDTKGSWHYVGLKGDYQGSTVSSTSGIHKNHRSRSYLAVSNAAWTETSVGSYSGYATNDYTNRKTAASVRCVKIK